MLLSVPGPSKHCELMTKIAAVFEKSPAGIDFLEEFLMVVCLPVILLPYLFCSLSSGADTL